MIAAARGYPPARGQAVLVGALRPASTTPSTNGPTTATSSSPTMPRSSPTGISRRGRASRSGTSGCIGELATGELGRTMYALYDPPAPAGLADDPDRRGVRRASTVVECDDPEAPTEVVVVERAAQGRRRLRPAAVRADAGAADQHQAAAGVHRRDRGRSSPRGCRTCPPTRSPTSCCAARRAPISGGPLPRTRRTSPTTSPPRCSTSTRPTSRCTARPGTGKTFTSAAVIARLVNEHGWRIGVVAQSHAVVENLFARRARAPGSTATRVGKKKQPPTRAWQRRSTRRTTPASSPTTTAA